MKGDDGQPRAVRITTGDTNGQVTEVLAGELREGMEVITGQFAGDAAKSGGTGKAGGGGQGKRGSGGG